MRVISPADVEPRGSRKSGFNHRRVVAFDQGGPESVDIGYNNIERGATADAYAHDRDEYCYTPSGSARRKAFGVTSITRAGQFMWCPTGAPTHELTFEVAAITICAFSPARRDDASHLLPREQVPEASNDSQGRPAPIMVHYTDVEPTPFRPAPDVKGVRYREIFSAERLGSKHMDVAHLAFDADVFLPSLETQRDEIWWLECGSVRADSDAGPIVMKPTQFLYRAPGETLRSLQFERGSVVVWWRAAPKR